MKTYSELLIEAYNGERFGDALFGAMAEVQPDEQRRAKILTLQSIEARTAAVLEPLVHTADLDPGDSHAPVREGKELGAQIDPSDWSGFVRGLDDALPEFLANFVRLRELATDPHDPAIAALVAHEQAISAFAQLEVVGHADISRRGADAVPRNRTMTEPAYRGEHVQLDLTVLEADEAATFAPPPGEEAVLVLLAGDVDIDDRRATRVDVFDSPATAVFLPPGTHVDVYAHANTELALAATNGSTYTPAPAAVPTFVEPADVRVQQRGQPGWQREVHDVVAENVPQAQRLIVGETFNGAGQWSSFPPHKHDGADGEPALEEVYYYRFDKPDGFGFQGLYETNGDERAVFLRHGSVVGIPRGYHPVCAAPGYRLYYLWALVGAHRQLAMYEDPAHRWLTHST